MMTGTKSDIEKFDGKNDFALWQVRMKALLEQQGLTAWQRSRKRNIRLGGRSRWVMFLILVIRGLSKVFWAEDTTMSTYLVNRSPSSAIGFKTPIDMLGIFSWLASIKQGMLEPVKVNCIFLGYRKRIVGTGSMQVLQGDEFKYREDSNEAAFAVAAVEKIYAHESFTFNNTVACEVISKWKAGLKDDMDARLDVYVLSNGCRKCSDDSDGYYWESTPGFIMKSCWKPGVSDGLHLARELNIAIGRCGYAGYSLIVDYSQTYQRSIGIVWGVEEGNWALVFGVVRICAMLWAGCGRGPLGLGGALGVVCGGMGVLVAWMTLVWWGVGGAVVVA
ncbi:hypothetical protein Tco_0364512 [Tanacetum coccineum]